MQPARHQPLSQPDAPPPLDFGARFAKSPLSLGQPWGLPAPHTLRSPGGFAWWYAELREGPGDGAVLIWSQGLPFLPGYRRSRSQCAMDRPSLNLAVYRDGKPSFYHLGELDPADFHFADEGQTRHWRLGDSEVELSREADELTLRARLDVPLAGSWERWRGHFRLSGPAGQWCPPEGTPSGGRLEQPSVHRWTPLITGGHGALLLKNSDQPGREIALQGDAYLDRNASSLGLDVLGIERWEWLRLSQGSRTWVVYRLRASVDDSGQSQVFELFEGQMRLRPDLRPRFLGERRGRYGVRCAEQVELWQGSVRLWRATLSAVVDDAPFYLRALMLSDDGQGGGSAEVIRPQQIDRAWQAPLVRMRVHQPDSNSAWLPLFQGSVHDRARRLARTLRSRVWPGASLGEVGARLVAERS